MEENLGTFEAFSRIISRLRSPEGCPWDRQQTHLSLKPYLIEEAYEVLGALESGDTDHLCEELGDLLLQIGLHSQIAAESGEFEMADVLRRINEKLIRRHPHVFGDTTVSGADEVSVNWEQIKRAEGKAAKPLLEGVPQNIPALAHSQMVQQRAARVGFDWPTIEGVLDKVTEELEEIRQARTHRERADEFGDLLFSLANAARWMDIDLETALRDSNQRFRERFACMEELSRHRGVAMNGMSLEALDALWNEAKATLAQVSFEAEGNADGAVIRSRHLGHEEGA